MISLGAGIVGALRGPSPWLAVGVAFAAASLAFYAWQLLGAPGRLALLAIEAAVLGAAVLLPARVAREPVRNAGASIPRALLVAALVVLGVGFALGVQHFPDGAWDAVDIWNARARALVRSDLAAALVDSKHPDYPILLPLSVAHGWTWLGEGRWVPVAVGGVFGLASAGLLGSLAAARAGRRWGAVLVVLLVASPTFAVFAASQRADVPLGYFMLATSGVLAVSLSRRDTALLPLAGVLLGAAAFTKNEGLVFAGVAGLAWASVASAEERRAVWRLGLGAAPMLAALLHHKLTCGSTTDLIAMQDASLLERALDPSRLLQIAAAFVRQGGLYALACAAVLAAGRSRETAGPGARFTLRVLLGMLAGYFAVYMVTPRDLTWHLSSSLDRLIQQLWPLALLALAWRLEPDAAGAAVVPSSPMQTPPASGSPF